MSFLDRFRRKDKPAEAASPPVPDPAPAADTPESAQELPVIDGAPRRKGVFRRFESNIRRAVDGYVDKKADALMDDATRRAAEFRQETLDIVQDQALELLDITEQRIDRKLQEVESMLEQRLRAELRMRLRALVWTLAFVLLMALISAGYVWLKQRAGLNNTPPAAAETSVSGG